MSSDQVQNIIKLIPKAELHLHLEGTILPSTIVELSCRNNTTNPLTEEQAKDIYKYTTFSEFLDSFNQVISLLVNAQDYELVAWRMIESLVNQGVVHAEVFVSVGIIMKYKSIPFHTVFEALERARKRGESELGMSIFWIFDACRHESYDDAVKVFREAIELRKVYPSVVGIGLGGDERHTGSAIFRDIFAEAKLAGLRLTNHAGETTGPEAIWEAMTIGSERLGHVLSACKDPLLLQELKRQAIPVELNPTSNIRLGLCTDFASHPLRMLFEAGLLVTLNSDDPAFFGSDLANEYYLAHSQQHFSVQQLCALARNSFQASFLSDAQKIDWIERVNVFQHSLQVC